MKPSGKLSRCRELCMGPWDRAARAKLKGAVELFILFTHTPRTID
jgi:hypothetical protein